MTMTGRFHSFIIITAVELMPPVSGVCMCAGSHVVLATVLASRMSSFLPFDWTQATASKTTKSVLFVRTGPFRVWRMNEQQRSDTNQTDELSIRAFESTQIVQLLNHKNRSSKRALNAWKTIWTTLVNEPCLCEPYKCDWKRRKGQGKVFASKPITSTGPMTLMDEISNPAHDGTKTGSNCIDEEEAPQHRPSYQASKHKRRWDAPWVISAQGWL